MDNNTKEVIEWAMFVIMIIATIYIINLSNRD